MNHWARNIGFVAGVVLLTLIALGNAMAAQSTADAVADDTMKEKLRSELVGKTVFPGEEKEYIIGYGDVLGVSVYGEGDMAVASAPAAQAGGAQLQTPADAPRNSGGGVAVRMDGRISLLHVGDVNVVGLTLTQLADYLKKLYSTVFSNPIVTTVLVQSNSRRYTVMGQVKTPGVFYLDYPITVVQTIARSGGFTEWANHDITVVRGGAGGKESGESSLEFDYDDLVRGKKLEKNIYIKPGDIIIVH